MEVIANTQSAQQGAKDHGKALLQSTIGRHPVATSVIIAILIITVLILAFYIFHYKGKCKSGFMVSPVNNLMTGNNNPEWQLGSMDAGNWGPVHREATPTNVAIYHPGWRTGNYRRLPTREGLATAPGVANPCAPGETPVSYQNPDGEVVTYCKSTEAAPGPLTACGTAWDPAASAEAQALATTGTFQHDFYGERRLQGAVNSAYDSSVGLSDEQLTSLMHQGGTP